MPKLIPNVEDRIFLSAKELFHEKGYDQVNMKEISKRADIAVGTLYNYFANKNDLYFAVLEKSWNKTFEKLDELLSQDLDKEEKIKSSLTLIYEDVLDRRCMGIQVRKVKDLKGNKSIEIIENKIVSNVKAIFEDIKISKQFEDDENILDKVVYSLLINVTMLVDYYPNDKARNIEYLYSGIVGFFR